MNCVPKPLSGYDLKLELATQAIVWALYGSPEAEAEGHVVVDDNGLAIARHAAEKVLAVLQEFEGD